MNYQVLNPIASLSSFSRISPFVIKEIRQELRSRFLFVCLAFSTIILLTVFWVITIGLTTENLSAMVEHGGSIDTVYYFCCTLCLFLIGTGRAHRNFIREMDAGSLELLYLTGIRSFDILLGKWMALGLQGFLIMVALFPFALVGYFMSGADIPSIILKTVGLYTLFLVLISITLADAAQDGTRGKGGRTGFTIGILTCVILGSTRPFSTIGTVSISDLILEQLVSATGLLQLMLTVVAVGLGIRLTLHRGAATIAPPFERTVLLRRLETILFGGILCLVSIGRGGTLLATSGLLGYFAYIGIMTTVNLVIEKQRKIVLDKKNNKQGNLLAILKTGGWRGGTLIIIYLCLVTAAMLISGGLEPSKAICISITIASSTLASRFYLGIIETKRDCKPWDFLWFQAILNIILGLISHSGSEALISPIMLLIHIAQPSTRLSPIIMLTVFVHFLILLTVLFIALFSPIEYRDTTPIEPEEPVPASETAAHE